MFNDGANLSVVRTLLDQIFMNRELMNGSGKIYVSDEGANYIPSNKELIDLIKNG